MRPELRLDRIGATYVGLAIAWNITLAAAMLFLWTHRQQPSLRMRKLPLMFGGVLSLHVYGNLCIIAYPIRFVFPCNVEFWIMSIYLPLGIALFHAANTQFLHLASRQKHFAHISTLKDHQSIDEEKAQQVSNSRWRRIVAGVERADNVERTLVLIGVGLVVQLALTVLVFFGSRKFHSGYGIFNYTVQGTGMEVRMSCAKGWEWWLSIVWQLFWSWIYAPYVLWKSRGIRDVHGWRLQTICCCLAGLPASPLWLASLYAPQFIPLITVFPAPTWFAVCIFFMEVFAIGFPILDVLKGNSLRQETLEAIANWENRQAKSGLDGDSSINSSAYHNTTLRSTGDDTLNSKQSFESRKSDMLTMTALENALRTNAVPLLEFAALKDFSGENVSFLTHVADWRRYWFTPKSSTTEHRRTQFIAATRIYAHFISLEFSEFPINISSREMKRLHNVFETAATLLYRSGRHSLASSTSDNATPFDNVLPDQVHKSPNDRKSSYSSTTELQSSVNLDALGRANFRAVSRMQDLYVDEVLADVKIPEAFTEMVFDPAESEIKYLVLTNTWPKFVNVGRANSQLSKDIDQENGNVWMRKVLCSK
ncbi:uncharacterized protein K460DRAFT_311365 [Cucurbitaria berberidis CBS 394.84]|uniref:RGS domain-containing protein n=1 Tax=Cucurbitaria berberidis CBS 394.84 TaxID=1168544 RepID=A0A9P4L7P9_9PLEO|nr:uncharacterized protein K460DRAFT_311365 [Cucurbitaria berberidis CBS 394.84]KAF1845210.1 hypothetical protein K460DRAFT_311365 [Cucurbitaria berberidis CBS 394.84]